MKNVTIKNLVNQVKKAITTKSSFGAFEKAYANNNGDLIAHTLKDNADIYIFVAGIVEDISARDKIYTKDALTLAADTGIFKGGAEVPENYGDVYTIPTGEYIKVGEISADDLKTAAATTSKDNSRPVLTAVHIATAGKLESCDGFRAYSKRIEPLDVDGLSKFEMDNGLLLSAAAAAYNLKGNIEIYNSEKFIKLVDESGIILFVHKVDGQYINLAQIMVNNYKTSGVITIKDVKGLTSVLKTAAAAKDGRGRGTIFIRANHNRLDYYIPSLDIFGSIDADGESYNPELYLCLNPKYLMDAINQDCTRLDLPESKNGVIHLFSADESSRAIVLPIRDPEGVNPFERMDAEAKAAAEKKQQPTPAADTEKKFLEVPEALTPADFTDDEKEALKRINDRQNAAGRFENITREDVKKEAEKIAAERQEAADDPEKNITETPAPDPVEQDAPEDGEKLEIVSNDPENIAPEKAPEVLPPEIIKAQQVYKELKRVNFTPTEIQEAETAIIYRNNRERLQPIAKKAGGLYIDTLSIIAAIMATYQELK